MRARAGPVRRSDTTWRELADAPIGSDAALDAALGHAAGASPGAEGTTPRAISGQICFGFALATARVSSGPG